MKAKELSKGRLLLSMEDSQNVASFYGTRLLLEGETKDPAEIVAKIEGVTKDQVIEVAKDIFKPEHLNLALIGPLQEGDITVEDLVF